MNGLRNLSLQRYAGIQLGDRHHAATHLRSKPVTTSRCEPGARLLPPRRLPDVPLADTSRPNEERPWFHRRSQMLPEYETKECHPVE